MTEAQEKIGLPKNPYTTEYKYQCSMDAGMPQNLIVNDDACVAYEEAQQDMIKAGYRKPPKLDERLLLNKVIIQERAKNIVGAPYGSVLENLNWLCETQLAKVQKHKNVLVIGNNTGKELARAVAEATKHKLDRPELRYKANDLLVNCSTHFENDQLEAALDVFDQLLPLTELPEKPPVLSDVGGKDTQRAVDDLKKHKLPSLFSYRQAYFVGAQAMWDIWNEWYKAISNRLLL